MLISCRSWRVFGAGETDGAAGNFRLRAEDRQLVVKRRSGPAACCTVAPLSRALRASGAGGQIHGDSAPTRARRPSRSRTAESRVADVRTAWTIAERLRVGL